MGSEWRSGRLGDFIELKRGYDLPRSRRTAGPHPLVSSSGVTDSHSVSMVRGPGVITGRYGTIGQVFFVEKDFWPLNTTLYVCDFKGNYPKFVGYFLKSLDFGSFSDKAAVPGINRNHVHEAKVLLPDVSTQRMIAHALGALDAGIDLLRETNATLESIAQALFKSWFVDFDPVRAKQRGELVVGVDDSVAKLFPSAFDGSSEMKIPEGWHIRKIGEVVTVGIGKTPPRKEPEWFSDTAVGVRWLSIRDMAPNSVYVDRTSERLTEAAVTKFKVRVVPSDTTVLSFKMTIGRVAITNGEMVTNEAIAHFKSDRGSGLSSEFIYLVLKQFDFHTLSSTSSIVDAVNSETVRGLPVLVPSVPVLMAFQDMVGPIFQRMKLIGEQAQTLATLRDTLLPRLISGQLRLPETETEALSAQS